MREIIRKIVICFSTDFDEITDFLAAVSPILAALVAFVTAKFTARHEIRKQKMQWAREDNLSENRDFSDMVAAVSRYTQSGWSKHQREAMERISRVQAAAPAPSLNALWDAVAAGSIDDAQSCLQNILSNGIPHGECRSGRYRQRKR